MNCTTTRVSTGVYQVNFINPMPSASYAPALTSDQAIVAVASPITANGFRITTFELGGTPTDAYCTFVVFATNALPPSGGTGADAWAQVQGGLSNGPVTINASFTLVLSGLGRVSTGQLAKHSNTCAVVATRLALIV